MGDWYSLTRSNYTGDYEMPARSIRMGNSCRVTRLIRMDDSKGLTRWSSEGV